MSVGFQYRMSPTIIEWDLPCPSPPQWQKSLLVILKLISACYLPSTFMSGSALFSNLLGYASIACWLGAQLPSVSSICFGLSLTESLVKYSRTSTDSPVMASPWPFSPTGFSVRFLFILLHDSLSIV